MFAGITPAWAGKSILPCPPGPRKWDHPRVGGEKAKDSFEGQFGLGSPPRGRGKVQLSKSHIMQDRITPAWAGKRYSTKQRPIFEQDHPRVGGEKKAPPMIHTIHTGSPPRGRGKGGYGWLMLTLTGITPAWAGKSDCCSFDVAEVWDHPRVGGEKLVLDV